MEAVKLRPHQEEAVEKLSNGKILYGGTGVGKSITAMAYYVSKVCGGTYGDFGSMRTPRDVYVITTAKKRDEGDWEEEAIKFGVSTIREASPAGVKLTVDSWNNIDKYLEVRDAFFIFDEQRSVGSGAWAQSLIKIAKRNQWIMLTATPGDTWIDYITVFVANGWYKNRTEFKRRHCVYSYYGRYPKLERYLEVGTLVRYRNRLLVHMPYERHTTRHEETLRVSHDEQLFKRVVKDRWHVYEERPLRDVAELFSVMRKVVNSDPSRLTALASLMERHPKLIVFYNFDYELEILRTLGSTTASSTSEMSPSSSDRESSDPPLPTTSDTRTTARATSAETSVGSATISDAHSDTTPDPLAGTIWELGFDEKTGDISSPSPTSTTSSDSSTSSPGSSTSSDTGSTTSSSFEVAEWNGHKHEPIPTSDRWVYLVQYTAGSEGWNCITTDAVCFYSLTYSWKAYHQAHGRIDRLNTPFEDLWYYSLVSDSMIDRAILKALRNKKSFNERDLLL